MVKYVLGFMFTPNRNTVWLIQKNRPVWQKGKLNGIGGHIEAKEDPTEAMVREFFEETGIMTKWDDWELVCVMGRNVEVQEGERKSADFECYVFRSFVGDYQKIKTMTDELVSFYQTNYIIGSEGLTISNLPWLIAMCLDNNDGFAPYEVIGRIRPSLVG